MKFQLLAVGLALVAVAHGDSICTYTEADCSGTETCEDVADGGVCAAAYLSAEAGSCVNAPTASCAAPNACRTGGQSKYKCNAVNFTDATYAVRTDVVEAVFLQSWPLANCSGQPYPENTVKAQTSKCVATSSSGSFMLYKEEWSDIGPTGLPVIQTKYTSVGFTNRYCIPGSENPYGRRSNWAERFQNIGTNTTYSYDALETIGGVIGTCTPTYDNTTRPDTNTATIYPYTPPWTLSSAKFVSLVQPSGLNVGQRLIDYDDGDTYATTATFTVESGACYSNEMYTGCATSKQPMMVRMRTTGRFASAADRWPYVPGCNGTEYDHVYSVVGAGGCESNTIATSTPDNNRQMYTSCSVSGNQITWTVQTFSDSFCEHVNDYLDGLTNFQNFPGAVTAAGAGLVRSTVTVVTAALLAAVLV